jgi:hypothetical protein
MGSLCPPMWAGSVLVSGLSDTHSDKLARMTLSLLPSVVLGGWETSEADAATLVPRLLLIGVTITLDASGTTSTVRGHPALSRDVTFRPCGEAAARASFHAALLAAAAAAPSVRGIALISLVPSRPALTPAVLSFVSNKHRAVLRVEPCAIVGVDVEADAASRASAGAWPAGAEVDVDIDATVESLAQTGSTVFVSGPGTVSIIPPAVADGQRVLCKVVPAGKPFFLKIAELSDISIGAFAEGASVGVKTLERARALFGLFTYKRQGALEALQVRALRLLSDDAAFLSIRAEPTDAPTTEPLCSVLDIQRGFAALADLLQGKTMSLLAPRGAAAPAAAVPAAAPSTGDDDGTPTDDADPPIPLLSESVAAPPAALVTQLIQADDDANASHSLQVATLLLESARSAHSAEVPLPSSDDEEDSDGSDAMPSPAPPRPT